MRDEQPTFAPNSKTEATIGSPTSSDQTKLDYGIDSKTVLESSDTDSAPNTTVGDSVVNINKATKKTSSLSDDGSSYTGDVSSATVNVTLNDGLDGNPGQNKVGNVITRLHNLPSSTGSKYGDIIEPNKMSSALSAAFSSNSNQMGAYTALYKVGGDIVDEGSIDSVSGHIRIYVVAASGYTGKEFATIRYRQLTTPQDSVGSPLGPTGLFAKPNAITIKPGNIVDIYVANFGPYGNAVTIKLSDQLP